MSTGTGLRSVAKPDLHSALLMVKRTNKRCCECYLLERDRFDGGSLVVWGGKMGDQKTYFVVMQDNFNALYRRRLLVFYGMEWNGTYGINRIENYKFFKESKTYIQSKHKSIQAIVFMLE